MAALVFHRLRRLPAWLLGVAAVALMFPIAHAYLTTGSPYYPYSWLIRIACGFAAGVLVCLAVRKVRARRTASVAAAVLPVLIAAGLVLGERLGPGRGGAVIALFPLLVGTLALADRGPAAVLARPLAVYGGRLSYALYLVHIPLFEVYWTALQHVRALGPHTLLAHLAGVGVLVAALGVAALAYSRIEEPARRRLLSLRRPGRHQLPAGMRVPPIDGVRRAPRHALVLAGHPRPYHRAI